MGNCIICSREVDGRICQSHQEDVVFDFRGNSPNQLIRNRFYRGVVDGYADFGVFIDLSPKVTGLLHRSELDGRLESLNWEPGDTVYVQVKSIRDNGNVDLTSSIRQSDREFRGTLIQDGTDEKLPKEVNEGNPSEGDEETTHERSAPHSDGGNASAVETEVAASEDEPAADSDTDTDVTADAESETEAVADEESGTEVVAQTTSEPETAVDDEPETEAVEEPEPDKPSGDLAEEPPETKEVTRRNIGELGDRVGELVRIEGEVVSAHQTGGPTIFELRDETGVADCAAFVEAGVRAYPEIELGDVVRLDGEVELRHDEIQVETEALVALEGDDAAAVQRRLADAMTERARPDELELVAGDERLEAISEELLDAAEAVRRAVLESRPIVVRHAASADGYVAGVALERAVLPLVREEHATSDAEYHYLNRRPLEDAVYGMNDATNDVTRMLQDRDRHDEKLPLVVLAGTASTVESQDGLEMLGIYGAERVVVDAAPADPEIADTTDVLVNPEAEQNLSTGALAASLATTVNADVREELAHLPAVSYWENTPENYVEAATEAGFDDEAVTDLREAVALEAYYQSYDDKRELVGDLLFGESQEAVAVAGAPADVAADESLAGHIAAQFREKLDTEVETAQANIEHSEAQGVDVAVLDTDSYTHTYDFPPTSLLMDVLHRRGDAVVTVGISMDKLWVRADTDLDLRAVAHDAAENAPNAGISASGLRQGRIEFLSGAREAVESAIIGAVTEQFD
ncbi:nucleic acid binding OB-fold tRNA/helicase-type [halophilic archaeon DL31]|jgi:RecJ-like exonuclease|nr:nucleic acid binding OB-fold tRNA/helicase-type [halophilic archaeon DL31]